MNKRQFRVAIRKAWLRSLILDIKIKFLRRRDEKTRRQAYESYEETKQLARTAVTSALDDYARIVDRLIAYADPDGLEQMAESLEETKKHHLGLFQGVVDYPGVLELMIQYGQKLDEFIARLKRRAEQVRFFRG